MDRAKLYIYVTPEFDERFTAWAERLGLTKSQFGSMCLQTGMQHLIQAISPMDAITPDQLARILQVANEKGIELDVAKLERGQNG